jgi:hypothetical protein
MLTISVNSFLSLDSIIMQLIVRYNLMVKCALTRSVFSGDSIFYFSRVFING